MYMYGFDCPSPCRCVGILTQIAINAQMNYVIVSFIIYYLYVLFVQFSVVYFKLVKRISFASMHTVHTKHRMEKMPQVNCPAKQFHRFVCVLFEASTAISMPLTTISSTMAARRRATGRRRPIILLRSVLLP